MGKECVPVKWNNLFYQGVKQLHTGLRGVGNKYYESGKLFHKKMSFFFRASFLSPKRTHTAATHLGDCWFTWLNSRIDHWQLHRQQLTKHSWQIFARLTQNSPQPLVISHMTFLWRLDEACIRFYLRHHKTITACQRSVFWLVLWSHERGRWQVQSGTNIIRFFDGYFAYNCSLSWGLQSKLNDIVFQWFLRNSKNCWYHVDAKERWSLPLFELIIYYYEIPKQSLNSVVFLNCWRQKIGNRFDNRFGIFYLNRRFQTSTFSQSVHDH